MNIKGSIVIESKAGIAGIACFKISGAVLTIDSFGQNSCTSRLAYTPRPTKKKGLGQMVVFNRILQRSGNMLLPNNTLKIRGPVFSC
jgi:hypothetical protein